MLKGLLTQARLTRPPTQLRAPRPVTHPALLPATSRQAGCFQLPSSTSVCRVGSASAANTGIGSRVRSVLALREPMIFTCWTACACVRSFSPSLGWLSAVKYRIHVSFSITTFPTATPMKIVGPSGKAYAQIGSSTEGWVDVLAGRQVLLFGDERVIGPSNWTNVGRTFNVARVDFHHPGYKVSVFASSVVPGENTDLHNALPDNNLYGIYGSLQNVVPEGQLSSPMFSGALHPRTLLFQKRSVTGTSMKSPSVSTGKVRFPPASTMTPNLTARQVHSANIQSALGQAMPASAKPFARRPHRRELSCELNYASGTKNPAGHDWNTFDQLYPSNHDKYGFADLIGRRNLVQYRAGIEEVPAKKWKTQTAIRRVLAGHCG